MSSLAQNESAGEATKKATTTTEDEFSGDVTGFNETNEYIGKKNRRGTYITSITIPTFVGKSK